MHLHGEGAPGHEVGLGKGIILEHLVVSRRWAGRSLAALDLRGSTGVTVLEWLRGDAVLPVDPQQALREGDADLAVGIYGELPPELRTRVLFTDRYLK